MPLSTNVYSLSFWAYIPTSSYATSVRYLSNGLYFKRSQTETYGNIKELCWNTKRKVYEYLRASLPNIAHLVFNSTIRWSHRMQAVSGSTGSVVEWRQDLSSEDAVTTHAPDDADGRTQRATPSRRCCPFALLRCALLFYSSEVYIPVY